MTVIAKGPAGVCEMEGVADDVKAHAPWLDRLRIELQTERLLSYTAEGAEV